MTDKQKRMCSYCRCMKEKTELFRVVLVKGTDPYLDSTFKAQGRGAYICKSIECINGGQKKHSLERSLSHKISENIYKEMSELIDKQ